MPAFLIFFVLKILVKNDSKIHFRFEFSLLYRQGNIANRRDRLIFHYYSALQLIGQN